MSSAQKEWLYGLTIVVFLACFVLWTAPHLDEFVRSDDEGNDLMKARMLREGYVLYRDIWSDHPPLFTLLLAGAFALFGESVLVARGIAVAFGCLSLISTAWIGRLLGGRLSSLAAMAFLALSPRFFSSSRTVIIDLPAQALGSVALACGLMALHTKRDAWLLAAGLGLSASLMIKPIGAFLFVPLALIVWFRGRSHGATRWCRWGKRVVLLTLSVTIPLLMVFCLFAGPLLIQQVVGTYYQRQQVLDFHWSEVRREIADHLSKGGVLYWAGLFLALYGLTLSWRDRDRKEIVASVWLLTAVIAVCSQTPLRARYFVMVSSPVAALLSRGLHEATRRIRLFWATPRRRRYSPLVAALAIVPFAWGIIGGIRTALAETCEEHPAEEEAVAILRSLCTPDNYVISDDGMLTFRAGVLTPPELSVISGRRIETGQLTVQTLIAASHKYRPEAIVLWEKRLTHLSEYAEWVNQHYCLARAWGDSRRLYSACRILSQSQGLGVHLGSLFSLEGWGLGVPEASDGVVSPGETVLLTLRWQSLQPTDADYHVFCHLSAEALIAQWDSGPQRGTYPTYYWPQGEEVMDSYPLTIPRETPKGYYPLWVGMYDVADQERLPVTDAEGRQIGSAVLLTHVRVGEPQFTAPAVSRPREAKLGDQVQFLGYDLPLAKVESGSSVSLTLYWRCLEEMNTSYTVFTHVLDTDGNIVGQRDSIPQGGELPTTTWVADEFVVDHYEIPIQDVRAGPCRIEVGMYDPLTGMRLPVVAPGGHRLAGDRILLGEVHITD